MRTTISMLAGACILGLASAPALSACPDTGGSVGMQPRPGIAKDGTHAPLEANRSMNSDAKPVTKDGRTMPLADQQGGGDKNLATSQQDVQAQQHGGQTAAALADKNCPQQ